MDAVPRLIDLHTDWLLQYAAESTLYTPDCYPRVPQRLSQATGYLSATRAAILSCYRNTDDWSRQADPWSALGDLIARIEAEFCGRLFVGPEDYARWREDPDGLTWGVIGVEGFDTLVRSRADLARLKWLFERGVRLFQPVYSASSVLAGSAAAGDDRGLSELGREFLEALWEIAANANDARLLVDLAHLNPTAAGDVLDWFETDDRRLRRLIPVYSHGALEHAGCPGPRAISHDNLRRLRALGGVIGFSVGPPFYHTPESLLAGIDTASSYSFRGRQGHDGIAIGTDFLGVDQTMTGLGDVPSVISWVRASFEQATAFALLQGNATRLIEEVLGIGAAEHGR